MVAYFLYRKAVLPRWNKKILCLRYIAFANVEKAEGERVTQWRAPEKDAVVEQWINAVKMQMGG